LDGTITTTVYCPTHLMNAPTLTADEAYAKVAECLDLAERATSAAHRTMLLHMAETWQRIAEDIDSNSK
jgi:hypothetical protein